MENHVRTRKQKKANSNDVEDSERGFKVGKLQRMPEREGDILSAQHPGIHNNQKRNKERGKSILDFFRSPKRSLTKRRKTAHREELHQGKTEKTGKTDQLGP